jgi:hypothetical protein
MVVTNNYLSQSGTEMPLIKKLYPSYSLVQSAYDSNENLPILRLNVISIFLW